jgi:hypothetical protein
LTDGPTFFTPSYLRNSRYIYRLDAAHRAKLAQQRDTSSTTSASNPPLSASSSNVHLPRMAPSHRGMTYEIIEKEPPVTADPLSPLPSQWSSTDKYAGLELSNDALDVRYTGPVHKHDHEAAALRADYPMPPQCGIYYFEIKIESKPKEGYVMFFALDVQIILTMLQHDRYRILEHQSLRRETSRLGAGILGLSR